MKHVGRRSWRWVLEKENGKYVLYRERYDRLRAQWVRERVSDSEEEIEKILLSCPRCGERATHVVYHEKYPGVVYINLWHWTGNEKHMWFLAKCNEVWKEWLDMVLGTRELTEREKDAIYKYFVLRKGYTKEEKRIAKQAITEILKASKVIIS